MNPQEHTDVLIERYLKQKMSQVQQEQFENRLKKDEDLKKELEIRLKATYATMASGHDFLKDSLNKRYDKWESRKAKRPFRIWIPVAAVAFILLVAGLFIWNAQEYSRGDRLFTRYFAPLPISLEKEVPVSNGSSWNWVEDAYQAGNYTEAGLRIKRMAMEKVGIDPSRVSLYLGICELAQGNPHTALMHLEQVKKDTPYKEQADWYTALGYVKMRKEAGAVEVLSNILATEQHALKTSAQKLLSDLRG